MENISRVYRKNYQFLENSFIIQACLACLDRLIFNQGNGFHGGTTRLVKKCSLWTHHARASIRLLIDFFRIRFLSKLSKCFNNWSLTKQNVQKYSIYFDNLEAWKKIKWKINKLEDPRSFWAVQQTAYNFRRTPQILFYLYEVTFLAPDWEARVIDSLFTKPLFGSSLENN